MATTLVETDIFSSKPEYSDWNVGRRAQLAAYSAPNFTMRHVMGCGGLVKLGKRKGELYLHMGSARAGWWSAERTNS